MTIDKYIYPCAGCGEIRAGRNDKEGGKPADAAVGRSTSRRSNEGNEYPHC